jgi:hypothetical protein
MVNLLIRFLTVWRKIQTAYDLILGNVHILKLILRLRWFSFNILPLNTSWWIMQRKLIFAASFFIRFPRSTILGTSPCRRTIYHSAHKFVKWDFILCKYFLQFTESVFSSSSSTMHWNRYCLDLELFTEYFWFTVGKVIYEFSYCVSSETSPSFRKRSWSLQGQLSTLE